MTPYQKTGLLYKARSLGRAEDGGGKDDDVTDPIGIDRENERKLSVALNVEVQLTAV